MMLGIGDSVLGNSRSHGHQRARGDHGHVAGQDQPPWRLRPRSHAGRDAVAHAALGLLRRKHDDVASRHHPGGLGHQRFGGDDQHRQGAGQHLRQRCPEHGAAAQGLGELVPGAGKPPASARGDHDDDRAAAHDKTFENPFPRATATSVSDAMRTICNLPASLPRCQ